MNASACAALIRELYGDDLCEAAGVLHVAAVWQGPAQPARVLRINSETPRCETDAFVLALARARSDAIVTTGKILRDEPDLSHELEPSGAAGLADWRRDVLGKHDTPLSVILTSGQNLDFSHPVFRRNHALIYTGSQHPAGLGERAKEAGVELVQREGANLRQLIAYLRESRGARTISIEAGFTTARSLYDAPLALDELMLSLYSADAVPASVEGPAFPSLEHLRQTLALLARNDAVEANWSFLRLRRAD